jgi:hypothetical protein
MGFRALKVLAGTIALLALTANAAMATRTAGFIPSAQEEVPSCDPLLDFNPDNFPTAPSNDNKWLRLKPGSQFVLEGRANRGGGLLPHRVVFTVTDLTKLINGVNVRVLWDVDINEEQVSEAELAFFAEDWNGNVWLLGEYPEEYDGGVFKGAPRTWVAGTAGAEAGVQLPARLRLSGPAYVQGFASDVGFFDCGKDIIKGESTCVPVGCFNRVAVVEEWSPLDPAGGFQRKYYAPWVGNISIGAVDDPEGETLVLAELNQLDAAGLDEARAEALALDERAYLVSDPYRDTEPAQPGGKRPELPPPGTSPVSTQPPAPPALPVLGTSSQTAQKRSAPKRKRCASKRKRSKSKRCASKRRRCSSKQRRAAAKRHRCRSKKHSRRGSSG